MCMCKNPNVNGTPGAYSWNDGRTSTHPVVAPELLEGDEIIFDEPGRCVSGLDSHCHHVRLVRNRASVLGGLWIVCRNGGGTTRFRVDNRSGLDAVCSYMNSDARYLFLLELWRMAYAASLAATAKESSLWMAAVAQKRTKVRRRQGRVYVEIMPTVAT